MVRFYNFNNTAPTANYTLSLHDALPISDRPELHVWRQEAEIHVVIQLERPGRVEAAIAVGQAVHARNSRRSEEHTSELQSQSNLVCRLLLEKKKYASTSSSRATGVQNWS